METEQQHKERERHQHQVLNDILPRLVQSMLNEGLDDVTISRILMPTFGAATMVAQIRRIACNPMGG